MKSNIIDLQEYRESREILDPLIGDALDYANDLALAELMDEAGYDHSLILKTLVDIKTKRKIDRRRKD